MKRLKPLHIVLIVLYLALQYAIIDGLLRRDDLTSVVSKSSDLPQAVREYIRLNPIDPEGYYILARAIKVSSEEGGTIEGLLGKALSLDPYSIKYNLALAKYLWGEGKSSEARQIYQRVLEIPTPIDGSILSDIYCDFAESDLTEGRYDASELALKEAHGKSPQNPRIPLIQFLHHLLRGNHADARASLESSYMLSERVTGLRGAAAFDIAAHVERYARQLLSMGRYDLVRLLYDIYSSHSTDPEGILVDLARRYAPYPVLIDLVWGGKVSLKIFDPATLKEPILKNHPTGCSIKELVHRISDDRSSEDIFLSYSGTPSFIDLWYLPVEIPLRSARTSAMIIMGSDRPITGKQIAVEMRKSIFYSRGEAKLNGDGTYTLTAKRLLDYMTEDLQFKTADNNIVLTKLGFNTVCRNGTYRIRRIELYLED